MSERSQDSGPATPAAAVHRPAHARKRVWVIGGAFLALAAAGVVLVPAWRRHQLLVHIQAALPPPPPRSTMPSMLADRLAQAQRRAKSGDGALAGLADLGRLYDASGYPQRAEACWRLLHLVQPRDARWCYYLGDLRRSAGDYAEATSLFAQTTRLAPNYAPAWLSLAEIELKTGRTAAAALDYRQCLKLAPGDPYARLGLARVALLQGRRDEAAAILARLGQDAPAFPDAHNLYAQILANEGKTTAAARQRRMGHQAGRFRAASDPWLDQLYAWCYDFDRLCIRGTVDFQTKYGDRGKALFKRAIRIEPRDLTGYELLGSLYLEEHEPARACKVFEEGLKRATKPRPTPMFYVYLSRAYRQMKEPAKAVQVARQGLAKTGDAFELYDALGTALGDLGRHREAVQALQAAVARSPNDADANYNLALALIEVRRLGDAVAALHRSLTLKPTFASSLALLAQIEIDSGRWQSAEKYLRPLYEAHPDLPQARAMMAQWHLHAANEAQSRGDIVAAEKQFRDGLAIEPGNTDLLVGLGALYLTQHRFADALVPLETYHRLVPGDPRGDLYLAQACAATGRRTEARRLLTQGRRLATRAGDTTTARYCQQILDRL